VKADAFYDYESPSDDHGFTDGNTTARRHKTAEVREEFEEDVDGIIQRIEKEFIANRSRSRK